MAKAIQYRKRTRTKANSTRKVANAKPRSTRTKKVRLQ